MKSLVFALIFSVVFMASCGGKPKPEMESETVTQPQEEKVDQKISEAATDTRSAMTDEAFKPKFVENGTDSYYEMLVPGTNGNVSVKLPIIFFAFDKFDLTGDSQNKLKNFADFVKANGLVGLTVHIGGHCDEWGSDEYNYALGLKRAKAVEDALKDYEGSIKVTVTSFGESKPLCTERNKNCWKENRRSEVKFLP